VTKEAITSYETIMNVQLRHGLGLRLIVPILLTVLATTFAIWLLVPRMIAANATDQAVLASRNIAAQLKIVREYYTENVLARPQA
jgi:hypothetical protein